MLLGGGLARPADLGDPAQRGPSSFVTSPQSESAFLTGATFLAGESSLPVVAASLRTDAPSERTSAPS
jgi:hypothetical protein